MKESLFDASMAFFMDGIYPWHIDAEMQAVFLAGLCFLGAWVILSWFVEIIKSVLWIWPFVAVSIFLIMAPSVRLTLSDDIIPKKANLMADMITKFYSKYLMNKTQTVY